MLDDSVPEVTMVLELTFGPDGLLPAVAQDARSGAVLMLAYMNQEALERTLESGRAWYWSRSRKKLWQKGEDSGHTQQVREVRVDCDKDAILLLVDQTGPVCHTGHQSCFFRDAQGREISPETPAARGDILEELFGLLRERRAQLPEGSYSAELFRSGRARIGAKVMEEAEELTRAARGESDQRVVEEAADLLYHSWVLLLDRRIDLQAVRSELERRRHGR